MNQRRQQTRRDAPDVPAPDVAAPAPHVAGGSNEYISFVWQQLNDMQSTIGRLSGVIEQQTAAIGRLEQKADETKEKIHSINVKLAVAGAAVAIVAAVSGFVLKEIWDVAKPVLVQRLTEPAPADKQPQEKAKPQVVPGK